MVENRVIFGFLFPFYENKKKDVGEREELHNLQYSNLWKEDFKTEQHQQQQQQ